VVVRHTTL